MLLSFARFQPSPLRRPFTLWAAPPRVVSCSWIFRGVRAAIAVHVSREWDASSTSPLVGPERRVQPLALPCLALPCLALPCLALPCLALPSRRPRPLHSCGWTVGIVRHACCTSARARAHAQAPSRLSARIHSSEWSRRVAARRVVGPVCPVYDHALELGRLPPHYSLLLTANTCTPIAHIIRRADLPNPDPPACT